ncbi:uncharacterized protein BO88DRAFT_425548 [Aspergillus vadensis CBS 113365]|uniref:Uncharacterized protein n=1 Tax=Aspergillus vadensis (strain CBS 113365 / IMI 142717 / IBT 24658) TaxID=1448311 RepID=A0A319B9Z4_ASPVC|nr:hypothetical protein BO88DRAFT_425548 [Aspergillus vadensis CBS 113365]PYH69199.1 hypothetical protein BO88DRAFT_425548 [Aspergillus vadensis CBS 113365]
MSRIYTRPEILLLIFLAGAVKLDGVKAFRWLKGKACALCWQFVSQRSDTWRRILTLLRVKWEAIRARTVEIAAKVRPLVVAVMKEVQEAALELYGFVVAAFIAIKQWFTCEQRTSHDHDGQARNAWCKRVVLVVTVKSGRSYKAIKEAIGIDSDSPRMYRNRSENGSLPEPPGFMRHFAVCLVPEAVWMDGTTDLLQKFQHGSFFELVGPNVTDEEGGGVCWGEEKVRSIDGIVEIGLVTYDNEAIIESFYKPLRVAWGRYDPIWWNCSDFTIRLACIILPDPDEKDILRRLLLFVCASRLQTLEFALEQLHGRIFLSSWTAGVASWAGGAGSALLLGAFPAVFPIAFVGSCAFGMGSGIAYMWRASRVGTKEYPKWKARSNELEQRFPQLRGLVGE